MDCMKTTLIKTSECITGTQFTTELFFVIVCSASFRETTKENIRLPVYQLAEIKEVRSHDMVIVGNLNTTVGSEQWRNEERPCEFREDNYFKSPR